MERLNILYDYLDSKDCFPGVDIAGGVCYFFGMQITRGMLYVHEYSNGNERSNMKQYDIGICSFRLMRL